MKRFIQQIVSRFRNIPLIIRITSGVLLLAVVYVGVFIIPTNVQFSYANQESCVRWLTIAPKLQQQRAGSDEFEVKPAEIVNVFGVPLFAKSMCVSSVSAPEAGRVKVSSSPFGLLLFSKTFGINSSDKATVILSGLQNSKISAVKALTVPLSVTDVIYAYSLQYGEKEASCQSIDKGVSCAIKQLNLDPSTTYGLGLYRTYKDEKPIKMASIQVQTLNAVQLVESTIKNDATVYDKPADFQFTFDRTLDSVEATLVQSGDKSTAVDADFTVKGTKVIVTPKKPMTRSATYVLTLEQVTGEDGSSLAAPIIVSFTLSGGPKVTNVSIGGSAVAPGTRIIIDFDQPLKGDADIAKLARVEGVYAALSRASDTSIAVTLSSSAPLCAGFGIIIDKGLPSASNDEVSSEAWVYNSRIQCGYSSVIGYSVQGRAIISYTFGSGGSTILFTGGMHGSEPSGMYTMQAWVNYLQSYGYTIPANKKVVIVPNTNPDGIASGSRNNANNVNIDRNFPAANWRPDIDTASGLLPTGGGTSPGSEPETQAVMALTRQLRPILEVSFHAQGSLVGANQYGNSISVGTTYASMVGYATMIGNAEEVMGYSITGEYEDWMGQEMGIPAILIELPRSSGNYIDSQLKALLNLL